MQDSPFQSHDQLTIALGGPRLVRILRLRLGIGLRGRTGGERLLKVVNDVFDMFRPDRDPNEVLIKLVTFSGR